LNIYRSTASAGDVTDALQRAAGAGQEHAAAVSATAGRESSGHVPVHDVDSIVFDHRGADPEEFGAIGHDRRDAAGQKRGQRIGLDSRRFRRARSTGAAAARHRQMKEEGHFEFFLQPVVSLLFVAIRFFPVFIVSDKQPKRMAV
jgi:hypothetical protein